MAERRPATCKCGQLVLSFVRVPAEIVEWICPRCDHEWCEMLRVNLPVDLRQAERMFGDTLIEMAIAQAQGNVTEAASLLRMQRGTLNARIRRWGKPERVPRLPP